MNIVDSSVDDITLEEAAHLAGRSAKTLRRAVQSGILPRRYVIGHRGPQLVFNRGDLERWLSSRVGRNRVQRRKRVGERANSQPDWSDLLARVATLQTALNENSAGIAQLTVALREQAAAMSNAEAALVDLALKLDDLETRVVVDSVNTVRSLLESGAAPNSNQWTKQVS